METNDEWTNIGIISENKSISFVFAQSSYETTTSKIDASSFNHDIWESIGTAASKKTNINNGKLLYINAKLVSPKRKILKLTVDTEENLFLISYDGVDIDENGKKLDITDSNRAALNSIIPTLPITNELKEELKQSYEQGKNHVITKKVLDEISLLSEDDILVIPTTKKINIENLQTTEHSQRLTNEHYNLKIMEIEKDAKCEYEQYGSLQLFFSHFPKYDTKNDKLKSIPVDNTKEVKENLSFHAYVIVVRNISAVEKPLAKKGYLNDKIIDVLSVDFDYENNEMTVKNSNYSGDSQNVIIRKILELSK